MLETLIKAQEHVMCKVKIPAVVCRLKKLMFITMISLIITFLILL